MKIKKEKFLKLCKQKGLSGVARQLGVSRQLVAYHFHKLGGKVKAKNRLTIV